MKRETKNRFIPKITKEKNDKLTKLGYVKVHAKYGIVSYYWQGNEDEYIIVRYNSEKILSGISFKTNMELSINELIIVFRIMAKMKREKNKIFFS